MTEILALNSIRVFKLSEANNILPLIFRITEESHKKVKSIFNQIESVKSTNPDQARALEIEADQVVIMWQNKIKKLGAKPKGLWLADFDFGKGYYCWKYPETELKYFHQYDEGFSGRKLIENANSNCSD
jgi:hypothetical protein